MPSKSAKARQKRRQAAETQRRNEAVIGAPENNHTQTQTAQGSPANGPSTTTGATPPTHPIPLTPATFPTSDIPPTLASPPTPAVHQQTKSQQVNAPLTAKSTTVTYQKPIPVRSKATTGAETSQSNAPSVQTWTQPTAVATPTESQVPVQDVPSVTHEKAKSDRKDQQSKGDHSRTNDKQAGQHKSSKKDKPKLLKDIATDKLMLRVRGFHGGLQADDFPSRPEPGTEGTEVGLRTNHFEIKQPGFETIYQYTMTIQPRPTSVRMRRRILHLLLLNFDGLRKAATDYRSVLVSNETLFGEGLSGEFVVDYYGEGETGPRSGMERTLYTVVIDPVNDGSHELAVEDLVNYVSDPLTNAYYNPKPLVTALNLLLNRMPNQNSDIKCLGKNTFYNLNTSSNLNWASLGDANRRTLEAYVGVYKSVKICPGRLLLNANISASAFYIQERMDWLIDAWSGGQEDRQDSDRAELSHFIRGLRVQATHGRQRVYTVWGVANGGGRRPTKRVVKFSRKKKNSDENELITVEKYFAEEYPNFKLDYANDLVLNCGSETDPRYLPAESLMVLPGNAFTRLLEGRETSDMQKLACVRPLENIERIKGGLKLLGIPDKGGDGPEYRYDLKVGPELLQISGRRLPCPTLEYRSKQMRSDTSSGSWDLKKVDFLEVPKTSPKLRWSWIEFTEGGKACDETERTKWVDALRQYIPQYCPNIERHPANRQGGRPHSVAFPSNDPGKLSNYLRDFTNEGVSVLFVILQTQKAENYDLLKRVAELRFGLHTVCVVKKSGWPKRTVPNQLPSDGRQIASILMKVNMRLGGKNVRVNLPSTEAGIRDLFNGKNTMIVGADVTHPGPASMNGVDSVAAVVASEDPDFAQYPASFRCQPSKMEMIENLDEMLCERLEHWKKKNGDRLYPSKIIFYRDGVSEGQFAQVLELEWPQIQSAIHQKYGAIMQTPAQVVLLSVQKRHHTRFYPFKGSDLEDKNGNPKPGLIVDGHVTSIDKFDFFLQSHFALLGTARPANYVVLQDQIGCDVDALQKGTYWQCFTFGRSTTSISVHPAARYADLACNRARAYLREYYVAGNRCGEMFDRQAGGNAMAAWDHTKLHQNLKNSMFYI